MKITRQLSLLIFFLISNTFAIGGRTPVYAEKGMVVTSSQPASLAGLYVLKNGGNAIDAAIATAFAMSVTWPPAGNIAGGGFMVIHFPDGKVTTIDFREKAPLASTGNMYLDKNGKINNNSNHDGLLAVGVPGTVAGLWLAHQKYGSTSWGDLLAPAIDLAENGFPMPRSVYNDVTGYLAPYLNQWPSTKAIFYKDENSPVAPGENWQQPDLAATLKRIQEKGHDGFYKGETAQKLATFMHENGGIITEQDLAAYQAIERKPIHGTYRGYDIYSMPPPSSGGVAIVEMLNMLEPYNLSEMEHNSAQYLHLLTEVMRRAFADRAQYLGDPDFNPNIPIQMLLSKEHAGELRKTIDLNTASKSDSALFNQVYESDQTTHFVVMDEQGTAVSLTYTLEQSYGSKIVAEGLGFLLNNEMGDFNPVPGITNTKGQIGTPPNRIAPEKRMLSSMSPTIVARDGKPVLLIGSPGGRTIINTVLQVILNVTDHNMNVAQAIEAGRMHHQWQPDVSRFEKFGISPDTKALYEDMGHPCKWISSQGCAMGIMLDPETGTITGASDSRSSEGWAAGY